MQQRNEHVVLIDLDGTLLDSVPALHKVYERFLERFDVRGSEEEFRHLNGVDFKELLLHLKKKHQLHLDFEELHVIYTDLLTEAYQHQIHLFSGVRPFVTYAKQAGWRLAVITSAERKLAQVALKQQGILEDFEVIITSEGLAKGKPDPEIYLEALKRLKVVAAQAVAIEDSETGVKAALAAGLQTLRFHPEGHDKITGNPYLLDVEGWDQILTFLRLQWST